MPVRYVIDIDESGERTHVLAFDSITEQAVRVLQAWDRPDPPAHFEDGCHPRRGDFFFHLTRLDREYNIRKEPTPENRLEWLGRTDLNGWDDIPRAVTEPWDVGIWAVDELRERLAGHELPAPRSIRRRTEWRDDPGGAFDFDRFADGQPAYRVTVNRHAISRQFVTLFVDNSATRYTDAAETYWRGIVAVVVAEKLEAAGYSVEIVMYDVGNSALAPNPAKGAKDQQNIIIASWVKRFEDPIDVGAIVCAASPWFFRILSFASYHLLPGEALMKDYGTVGTMDPAIIGYFTNNEDARIIEGIWSEGRATRRAREILQEFAGTSDDTTNEEGDEE